MCLFRIFLNMIVCMPTYPMNYNAYIYIHRIMYVEHDTTSPPLQVNCKQGGVPKM